MHFRLNNFKHIYLLRFRNLCIILFLIKTNASGHECATNLRLYHELITKFFYLDCFYILFQVLNVLYSSVT